MRKTPTNRANVNLVSDGYYIHHGKNEHVCKREMRLDVSLQVWGKKERVQIHLGENTGKIKGKCETNIALTLAQAEELLEVLLDITKYTLPEIRKTFRTDLQP